MQHVEQRAHPLEQGHERRVAGHEPGIAAAQDRVNVGVGHPLAGADDPVVELPTDHGPMPVHLHQARLDEPVDARIQAAQPGRQVLREHVQRAVREVHGRAALVGLGIQRAPLPDVVRHVGDVHAKPEMAVLEPLNRDRVVEVAGMLSVDRDDVEPSEIGAPGEVLTAGVRRAGAAARAGEAPRFDDCRLAMSVGQAVLADDDGRVDARVVDVAQYLDDPSNRPASGARPPDDLDRHHLPGLRAACVRRRHGDLGLEAAVERRDEPDSSRVDLEPPHEPPVRALEDLDDAALGPIAAAEALDARHHAVAVHRFLNVRGRDEHIRLAGATGAIGSHERVSAGVQLQPADDEIHLLGQAVPLAAHLHQQALVDEALELAPEACPPLARDRQKLHQLPRRGRVLRPFTYRAEQFVS